MSIVLNEYAWAENAIREHELGRRPYETVSRVAKYYTYEGYKKQDVRRLLDVFMLACDPAVSLVAWSDTLDSAAKYASKYPLIMIDGIKITKPEMEKIDGLPGKQLRRLAFTLLCVAKYLYEVSPNTDYWVNTPDNEIMAMANINTSVRRQSAMYSQLKDAGLIRFSKKIDNLSVQVLFVEDGEEAMRITDYRNLGYQYLRFHGEPYFVCENCGITTKIKDPAYISRKKYCDECAVKVRTRQQVNAVMRRRAAAKS